MAMLTTPARAGMPFFDVRTTAGSGSALISQAEGGTSFDKNRYYLSARLRTSRLGAEAPGTREEGSVRLTRELYYVTVSGRLGTSAPNSQGASYHIANGEAWFQLYGTDIGPEYPELSPVIWESSGPVPDPASLDRTWITRVGGVYTNINNHITTNNGLFILVDGVWAFSALETYCETTTIGIQGGGNRYDKILDGSAPVILQNVVDYWGNDLPISGWANTWQSVRFDHKIGSVQLHLAGTRLNRLAGKFVTMGEIEIAWKPAADWTLRTGFERQSFRGGATRNAGVLGLSRQW